MINLDDKIGAGTHWVALNMKNVAIECFDTFGLDCPAELIMLSYRFNVYYVYVTALIMKENNKVSKEDMSRSLLCTIFLS